MIHTGIAAIHTTGQFSVVTISKDRLHDLILHSTFQRVRSLTLLKPRPIILTTWKIGSKTWPTYILNGINLWPTYILKGINLSLQSDLKIWIISSNPYPQEATLWLSYHEIADYNPSSLIQIKLRTSTLNKFTPDICSFCRNKNVSHLPGSSS